MREAPAPTLAPACELTAIGDGIYQRDADRQWWAIGTLHGGYVLALAITAVEQELTAASDMTLQHLSLQYQRAFIDGPLRVQVCTDRRGRSLTYATVLMHSGDDLAGKGLTVVAPRRTTGELALRTAPRVAPYDPSENSAVATRSAPPMHQRMWFQPRHLPDAEPSRVTVWIAPRAEEQIDHRWLAVLADVMEPPICRAWPQAQLIRTVEMTYHARAVLPREDLPPGSPVLVVLSNGVSTAGFVDEDVEVWSPAGELLAQSRQLRFVSERPLYPPDGQPR
jgi:hypothetical protein